LTKYVTYAREFSFIIFPLLSLARACAIYQSFWATDGLLRTISKESRD